jgi:hypothetical protein
VSYEIYSDQSKYLQGAWMTAAPKDGQNSYFWNYLKLVIKIILSEPARLISHVRDAFRYYKPWKRSLTQNGSPLVHRIPWIPFACQDFIGGSVGPESAVFEFGSGGSTFYFLDRIKHLVSVEHDENWFATVKYTLDEEEAQNSEYYLEVPIPNPAGDKQGRCPFGYEGDGYPGMTFYSYASRIDRYDDNSFDLVMVDGRARNACLWHARRKVKPGGYLVLDNAERPEYDAAIVLMKEWKCLEFFGILPYVRDYCKTMVWKRPDDILDNGAVQ